MNCIKYVSTLSLALCLTSCYDHVCCYYDQNSYESSINDSEQGSMTPISLSGTYSQAPLQEIPISADLSYGVLDNGLTYYVHKINEHAETHYDGLVDISLVVKAGSLVEEDNKQGLAHFVEHVVFDGSKNYPGYSATEKMRRAGVAFGNDMNGHTYLNATVYELYRVPISDNSHIIDTCLHIIRDWASECTLADSSVERERSIVLEELRAVEAGSYINRSRNIWAGTRYADRMPWGTFESVSKITGDDIRRFYKKWYQPQNMALVIYGDIDTNRVIDLIKSEFSSLERGDTEIPSFAFNMENHKQPRAFVINDNTMSSADLLFTFSISDDNLCLKRNTLAWYVDTQSRSRLTELIYKRLERIRNEYSLFNIIKEQYDDNVREDYPFTIHLTANPQDWPLVVELVSRELEKMRKYGFTQKEARDCQFPLESNDSLSDSINFPPTDEYNIPTVFGSSFIVNHFVMGDYYIDGSTQNALLNHCNRITASYAQAHLQHITTDDRLTISVTLPDDSTQASSQDILNAYNRGRNGDIESEKYLYAEGANYKKIAHELVVDKPLASVVEHDHDSFRNVTTLKLSNGVEATIYYDSVMDFVVEGVRYGTMTNYTDLEAKKIKMLPNIVQDPFLGYNGGYDEYSTVNFEDEYDTYKSRSYNICAEDLLKMAVFRLMNTEIDSARFVNYKRQLRSQQPISKSYAAHVEELWYNTIYSDEYAARTAQLTPDEIDNITLDEMRKLSNDYRSSFNGMHFAIRSSYDVDYTDSLVIRYLGMLPSKSQPIAPRDIPAMHFRDSSSRACYTYKSDLPSAKIVLGYAQSKNYEYTTEQHVTMDALGHIMNVLLFNNIRLTMGNIYSFNVFYDHKFMSGDKLFFSVFTTCDPSATDKILTSIDNVINDMAYGQSITQELVDDYISNRMKNYYEYPRDWEKVDYLTKTYQHNGKAVHSSNKKAIKRLTSDKIRNFLRLMLTEGHKQELIIKGE